MPVSFRCCVTALCLALLPSIASAQPGRNANAQRGQPEYKPTKVVGTLAGMQGLLLQVKNTTGHPYLVQLHPKMSKVGVVGTAKPDFLKPGMLVTFAADLDKKGETAEPITELAIVSPSEVNTPGVFPEDRENKESTRFFVRGTVRALKEGKLTVAASGKQVVGELPDDAKITLESTDLSLARQGDEVTIDGRLISDYKSEGNNIVPGKVFGEQIDIKLSETLDKDSFKKKPKSSR